MTMDINIAIGMLEVTNSSRQLNCRGSLAVVLKQRYRMGFGQVSVVSVDAIEKAPTITLQNEPLTCTG